MDETLPDFILTLQSATAFEEAASAVLDRILAAATKALSASRYARGGQILRAMVHLRPEDSYRGLAAAEPALASSTALAVGGLAEGMRTSASAFRWVSACCSAVAIDVTTGAVTPVAPDPATAFREPSEPPSGEGLSRDSSERLINRAVTHVYALPIWKLGGRAARAGAARSSDVQESIAGMISIEVNCEDAVGQEFIWQGVGATLQLLADIAAPYLAALGPAPDSIPAEDELFPVVGAEMGRLLRMARAFAREDETLLVIGAPGVGKSTLARWCHARSKRRAGPFEVLDLKAAPEELQMGALFGAWQDGAESGAPGDHLGAVGRAEGGTLYIGDIDKLSLEAQAALLEVLDARRYRQLGEGAPERSADVRLIAGAAVNLQQAVMAGSFREDLFCRIHVLPLRVPSLDERSDEIERWADDMVNRRHAEEGREGRAKLSPAAVSALVARRWPGNLRQLDHVLRQAYALAAADVGEPPRDLSIEERHVAVSLGYEQGAEPVSALSLMRCAAEEFVREAERRGEAAPLDLDFSDAFRGMVLGAAVRRAGSKEAAFRLLGKAVTVNHRNDRKILRRELAKVENLYRTLGGVEESPFTDLAERLMQRAG